MSPVAYPESGKGSIRTVGADCESQSANSPHVTETKTIWDKETSASLTLNHSYACTDEVHQSIIFLWKV